MKILNLEQIKEVRWALKNIDFRNWRQIYCNSFTCEDNHKYANKAAKILYKYDIKNISLGNIEDVEIYLNECERISELLEIIYKNNLNILDTKKLFNTVLSYLDDKVEKEKSKYIEQIENKKLKDFK